MITLDPVLDAAQSSQSRRPLCRIFSSENIDPIPFDGSLLDTSTTAEQYPQARVHSTGRLFIAFAYGTNTIRYGYTDASRTYFTYVDFSLGSSVIDRVAVCELADASVGLIWDETAAGTRYVKYRAISVTGENFDPAVTGTIFSQSSTDYFSGPAVVSLSDDTYLMAYGLQDGSSHYHFYRRASSDFTTWSAAAEIPVTGLTDASGKADPALLEINTGDVWLLFDYVDATGPNGEECRNIYYVASDDKLATTLAAAAALTASTSYADYYQYPAAAQNAAGAIYLACDRLLSALNMDTSTTGWCGAQFSVSNMHIDVAAQKLYVVVSWMYTGYKVLICAAKIDLATWEIDDCWNSATTPAFPAYMFDTQGVWPDSYRGDGCYVPVGHSGGMISLLNADADTITTYAFYDFTAYGIAQNVTWDPLYTGGNMSVDKIWTDADNDRLYVLLTSTYHMQIGYFDLTDAGPDYTFTTIVTSEGDLSAATSYGIRNGEGFFEVNAAAGLIIVGAEGIITGYKGKLLIFDLATGGLWKSYDVDSNPTFPYRGLRRAVYNDGLLVGDFAYESLYGQADYRGVCVIDTATDSISYHRPSYASVDDYALNDLCLTDAGEYIFAANGYGLVKWDGGSDWTLYANSTVPGLTPTGVNNFINPVVYNPTTGMIIAGHGTYGATGWTGLVMVSTSGYIRQASYRIGTYSGSWSWSTISNLVQGYDDYAAALCFDPDDNSLYALWTADDSIKFDKALASFDLSAYLLRGESIEQSSSIDPHTGNWDADLSFSVSHGHLFDASNGSSLLRQYLAKGRRIEIQFGETVSGTDYYETARYYTVSDDGEMTYERGKYPVMHVEAETPRRRWAQIHIAASDYYTDTPENIISDLLQTYAGIDSGDISLGTWDTSATINYQFVDVTLAAAVDMIALHFGYAVRDGAGGTIEAVKITDAGAITRTYTDNSKLYAATPRNKMSDFTNRWTVECEEDTFTELLMAEELAAEFNAAHRWNSGPTTYRVNYTQGNNIFRNPRLEVVQSVQSLAFKLAGSCSEELLDTSHDEADETLWDTYCEIKVESPDLTPMLIALLATFATEYAVFDTTEAGQPVVVDPETGVGQTVAPGFTVPYGRMLEGITLIAILQILAATGNFQYKVYGQPVVKVRRTVQASANDTEMQTSIGQTIAAPPFRDPLCVNQVDCQAVADFRRMVGMGERRRWSAEMVADIANQEGDTVAVAHPYSGQTINVFLTDVRNSLTVSEGADGNGDFSQQFEGWRV